MYNPTMRETYGSTQPPGVSPPPYTLDSNMAGSEGHTQPPPYDESPYSQEPPPSYTTIFGKIKQARTESNGCLEFLKKILVIVLGTIGCSICLGITLALPITMIIIGSVYLHDCPIDRFIPVYLIVGGCFGLLKSVMSLCHRARLRLQDSDSTGNLGDDDNVRQGPIDSLISCFLLAWFICGCAWVYRIYQPPFEPAYPGDTNYCNQTVYLFAFATLTLSLAVVGITFCCAVCIAACAGCIAACMGATTTVPPDSR
ncbi:PREDICTED: uncharacterized protein LOC106817306 [Priapulus caudatus]|uniref:Uncharacterized protein LOC106817306 n=1 Tax=Priapulus caudatus TaxID=37621 RepID=A0ABM1EZ34_PRICU|nr:PREDICTED: uncharacterized protein LOC106817306 [Priapulus caudatus]